MIYILKKVFKDKISFQLINEMKKNKMSLNTNNEIYTKKYVGFVLGPFKSKEVAKKQVLAIQNISYENLLKEDPKTIGLLKWGNFYLVPKLNIESFKKNTPTVRMYKIGNLKKDNFFYNFSSYGIPYKK